MIMLVTRPKGTQQKRGVSMMLCFGNSLNVVEKGRTVSEGNLGRKKECVFSNKYWAWIFVLRKGLLRERRISNVHIYHLSCLIMEIVIFSDQI